MSKGWVMVSRKVEIDYDVAVSLRDLVMEEYGAVVNDGSRLYLSKLICALEDAIATPEKKIRASATRRG
jgi:hypothetical protein